MGPVQHWNRRFDSGIEQRKRLTWMKTWAQKGWRQTNRVWQNLVACSLGVGAKPAFATENYKQMLLFYMKILKMLHRSRTCIFFNLQILDDVGLNVLRWADILGTNTDISLCKPFKFSKFSTSTPPPPLSLSVSLFFFSLWSYFLWRFSRPEYNVSTTNILAFFTHFELNQNNQRGETLYLHTITSA